MKLILAIVFFIIGPTVSYAEDDYASLTRAVVDKLTLPSIERLLEVMPKLATSTSTYCVNPSVYNRRQVEGQYHSVMDAWQVAQVFAFGPLVRKGRSSRIHFWPGRVSSTSRYLRKVFREKPESLTDPKKLGEKSVAIHSMAAYEQFIFAKEMRETFDLYTCRIAAAIAHFQVGLIKGTLEEWNGAKGFREVIMTPNANGSLYRTTRDPANDIFGAFMGVLEQMVRLKIKRALGETISKLRLSRLENWRSRRAQKNLLINLATLHSVYSIEFGIGDMLRSRGENVIDRQVRNHLSEIRRQIERLPEPLYETLSRIEVWERLMNVSRELESLQRLLVGPVAGKLGLVVGFNSLDGD